MATESRPSAVPEPRGASNRAASRERGRRVQARVALVLLEALRDQDRPGEVLDDENVTLTLPRRFGLSSVVRSQITRYEQEARRGRRIPEDEVTDLIRLVTRRPDSGDLFLHVGRSLTAADGAPKWRRVFPSSVAARMARRRVQRRLRALFGGNLTRAVPGPFQLQAVHPMLMEGDPGGEACGIVTGLSEAVFEAYGVPARVVHAECQGMGGTQCVWTLAAVPGETPPASLDAEPEGMR